MSTATLCADDIATLADTRRRDDGQDRFARLVTPHLKDAYALARSITRSRADAEDVVQDACLRAFRAIWNGADINPRGWVLTIVRNTAYTYLRKNRTTAVTTIEDLNTLESVQVTAWHAEIETPETALIAKADTARLAAAVAKVEAPFRDVLVLRDIQGLSYRAIAEKTGVPIGTVMSRLARGRSRVMQIIENAPVTRRRGSREAAAASGHPHGAQPRALVRGR
jgi:RNA polymerase sigma-70 factor, ECF subfamily